MCTSTMCSGASAAPITRTHLGSVWHNDADLGAKDDQTQQRLINGGDATCDASVRSWFDTLLPASTRFPDPASGV